jgi:hypothetical protein
VRVRFPLFAKYCLALVLGVGVALPVTAGAQTKTTSKPASTAEDHDAKAPPKKRGHPPSRPPAQTAAAQRKARLARAQAQARAPASRRG